MNKRISQFVITGAALFLLLGLVTATASAATAATRHPTRTGVNLIVSVPLNAPSCDYTVNADNINIRSSPDGPATGYKLQKGFYWLSNPLKYSSVQGGQRWIYGENTGIHGWVGARYLDYSGSNQACKAPL